MATFPFEPPLPWLWSCHHCHARYPLGTTRRCLHDGHYFCGGTTASALTGKTIKRHRACGSEFDYLGWEDVLLWRKSSSGIMVDEGPNQRQGCENSCEYPSACHHRGSQVVVRNSPKFGIEDHRSFLEPNFFDASPSPSVPEAAETDTLSAFPNPEPTGLVIKNVTRVTRRNLGEASLASTTERDIAKNILRPSRSAPPCPLSLSPPTHFTAAEPVGARASAKELGLVVPPLDLSLSLPSFFSPDSSSSPSSPSTSSTDATSSEEASSSATRSSAEEEEDEEEEAAAAFNLFTKNITTTTTHPRTPIRPLLLPHNNKNKNPTKKTHTVNLRLNSKDEDEDEDYPRDIDMTDSIPHSPTSPTSPGYYYPPSLLLLLLTPKSPTSPTNPLYRHCRNNSSGSNKDLPPPLSPLSPRRMGAWDSTGGCGEKSEEEEMEVDEDVEMEMGLELGLESG